tara:strand:+ start:461 stop:712 length:252 start_codon:yes stop_codon:yes gene_type:complete
MKTETKTEQIYKFGIWFELDEIKEITESLYQTNKEGSLASQMNKFHQKANDELISIERKTKNLVSDQEVIESNEGICKGGNCD